MKKTKDKDKPKVSFLQMIRTTIYALNILIKASPGRVLWYIGRYIMWSANSMLELFFLRYAVNTAQSDGSFLHLIIVLLIIAGVQIIYEVADTLVNHLVDPRLNYQINSRLKTMMMEKTSQCELECYENPDFYNKYTMAMTNGLPKFNEVLQQISDIAYSVVTLVSSGILALMIDPLILVFTLFPILLTFVTKIRIKENYKLQNKSNEQNRRKLYSLRVFYQAQYAKEMRLSGIFKPIMKRFRKAVDDSMEIFHTYGVRIGICWLAEMVLQHWTSNELPLLYAAYQTLVTGKMQYGDCLIVTSTVSQAYYGIRDITQAVIKLFESSMFIEDVRYFMNYKPKLDPNKDGPKAEYGDIELKNISFRYAGSDNLVLKNVSMKIGRGEKIALVGHNGAGKTTLTKLLLRLYDPTEGNITMSGEDIRTLNLDSYRDTYASVLQDYRHFSMSVKENVLLRPEKDGDDELSEASLKKAGLWNRVLEMPNGIDSIIDREFDDTGTVLSGGQAQKMSIAHVYAKGSPVVILDEPTSALDPIAEYEMYETMMKACEGKSVIFISHRMSSAVMADRVYLLEGGEVAEAGTHSELMAKNGKYAELFRVQAENYKKEETA